MKWRREQTNKRIFVGLAFLVCTFLLGGCNGKAKATKDIGKTASERRKAEMLRQIDRNFDDVDAHFRLGQLYQADGLWSQAENQYSVALSFEPAHKRAQAARVKTLMAEGDTTKATMLVEEYIGQASVSAAASLRLAMAFQEQALDDYALRCYQQALNLAPTSAKINRQIGYYYLSRGNREMAMGYLSRSFQLDRNQPEVARELGKMGVAVRIPKKKASTKKLDKMVDKSDERLKQR